jgi:hypothetical protein
MNIGPPQSVVLAAVEPGEQGEVLEGQRAGADTAAARVAVKAVLAGKLAPADKGAEVAADRAKAAGGRAAKPVGDKIAIRPFLLPTGPD